MSRKKKINFFFFLSHCDSIWQHNLELGNNNGDQFEQLISWCRFQSDVREGHGQPRILHLAVQGAVTAQGGYLLKRETKPGQDKRSSVLIKIVLFFINELFLIKCS